MSHIETLIHGFLHEIVKDTIPVCIIEICCLFYSIGIKIFMHSSKLDSFSILDIENKGIINLKLKKNDKNDNINSKYEICASCYIPPNDGIFCINTDVNKDEAVAGIVLFDDDDNNKYDLSILDGENKLNGINRHCLPSNLIYCGDNNNSIIYSKYGDLYSSKLDLNLKHLNLNKFIQINENGDNFCCKFEREELSMSYLYGQNKLFAIKCIEDNPIDYYGDNNDDGFFFDDGFDGETSKISLITKESLFGIFDLNKNKWTHIDDYYSIICGDELNAYCFKVGICKYNYYDLDNVYVVSDNEHITKYDMVKNKWITLINPNQPNTSDFNTSKAPNVWKQDNQNILYYHYQSVYKRHFKFLDLRNNQIQSIPINDIHDESVIFL